MFRLLVVFVTDRKDHLEGNCLQGCNVCLDLYLYLYFLSLSTEVSEFVFVSVFLLATDRKDRLEEKCLKAGAILVLVIKAYQRCQRLMMAFRYFRYFDENGNSEVFFPGTLWLPVWLMIQRSEFT